MSTSLIQRIAESIGRNGPLQPAKYAARQLHKILWYSATSHRPIGTNVYDREWDLLVVLDACRVDALQAVASEFEFLDNIGSMWSLGSTSFEWMTQTFQEEYRNDVAKTDYLVGNGFAADTLVRDTSLGETTPIVSPSFSSLERDDFRNVDFLWEYGHDDDLGTVPPWVVTDRAIQIGRNDQPERLIAHYNPPHTPHLADAVVNCRDPTPLEADPFTALKIGSVTREEVISNYLDNLRLVLHEVRLLLKNFDAETVAITADHGESFGEWGQYGHPGGTLNPVVKKVPWAVTESVDEGGHTPRATPESSGPATDIEQNLADLGYLD